DRCPTGVATQDPQRQKALVVPDKIERVTNFHQNTLKALQQLIAAAGLEHPSELRPHHLVRRVSNNQVHLASTLLPFLKPGQLLDSAQFDQLPPVFKIYWPQAQVDSFHPAQSERAA
ncbi:MAG: FMN-binding glutamate synthase family protein, partial [Burkholderiales bacterium]|nr:FMN-binding glutamate synthase family protein [Burkholderiales bacterium]